MKCLLIHPPNFDRKIIHSKTNAVWHRKFKQPVW